MHVALNAQLLTLEETYRSAGVSNYSLRLLSALGCMGGDDLRLTALVNEPSLTIRGVSLQPATYPGHHPATRIAWEQLALPAILRRMGPDLHHGLVNVVPLASSIPAVVTVHDLSFERMPEVFPAFKRRYLHHLCAYSCRKARRIIAVSRQTADDVMAFYAVDSARIAVVYNGVGEEFTPVDGATLDGFRQSRGVPRRFVLYLGTLEPRKNLVMLLRAFAQWRAHTVEANRDVVLVLAGAKGWFYDEIFQTVQKLALADAVLFPGYVPVAELPDWYRAATVFVYPSLFEGFGLPVVEAMACGTPVLCSRAPGVSEAVGDAALVFDPNDASALATLLETTISSAAVRADLRSAGLAQAQKFTWSQTAEATAQVYRSALISPDKKGARG